MSRETPDEKKAVRIIDLWPHEEECYVCDVIVVARSLGPNYGIAVWEGEAVPDNAEEWGGVTVCESCYLTERQMRSERPDAAIPIHQIRNAAAKARKE